MKSLSVYLVIISISLLTLTECKVDNGSYAKGDVLLDITFWDLPDTSSVSTPFNLYLESIIENSCVNNLVFSVNKANDYEYAVISRATFENHGEACTSVEIQKDTTISITPTLTGKYYYYFWVYDKYVRDSVYIKP